MDPAAVVRVAEPERDVDHRQAGADQEDLFCWVDLERVGRPGIPGVPQALRELTGDRRRVRRRVVADREHRVVRTENTAVPEGEHDPFRPFTDPDHLAGYSEQPQLGGTTGLLEPRGEVLAVHLAGNEGATGDRGLTRAGEVEEVVGIVLEGAHAPRRDVQRVARRAGEVRDAADPALRALDQQQPRDARRRRPQQMDGNRRAAEARPHDRDFPRVAHARAG